VKKLIPFGLALVLSVGSIPAFAQGGGGGGAGGGAAVHRAEPRLAGLLLVEQPVGRQGARQARPVPQMQALRELALRASAAFPTAPRTWAA
jgi:hypothetical protein